MSSRGWRTRARCRPGPGSRRGASRPRGRRHHPPRRARPPVPPLRRTVVRGARRRLRPLRGTVLTWQSEPRHPHGRIRVRTRRRGEVTHGDDPVRGPFTRRRSRTGRLTALSAWWPRSVSRIVALRDHGALIPLRVLPLVPSPPGVGGPSGTLGEMRVALSAVGPGGAACSTAPEERRTVWRRGTPSRWNMPEALVGVTVRQPCCPTRDSHSVILVPAVVLAMQKMATIVALVRREPKCPPVRMV